MLARLVKEHLDLSILGGLRLKVCAGFAAIIEGGGTNMQLCTLVQEVWMKRNAHEQHAD